MFNKNMKIEEGNFASLFFIDFIKTLFSVHHSLSLSFRTRIEPFDNRILLS